jgi:hypothetical protein
MWHSNAVCVMNEICNKVINIATRSFHTSQAIRPSYFIQLLEDAWASCEVQLMSCIFMTQKQSY